MKSLSQHLKPYSRDDLMDIAERAGVTPRIAVRAQKGIPVSADHYLRLCNASGFDPVREKPWCPEAIGGFNHNMLALGVRLQRRLKKHSSRAAAEKMNTPLVTFSRLENGHPVEIETTLKACAYVGTHPFHYMPASRETIWWNSLKSQASSEAA